ncbi:MAG TPA: hypothetical protein VGU26_08145 [Gaiellaceae bacterium]|nr:hypothetical protein [Gaiellaceae bacterium]
MPRWPPLHPDYETALDTLARLEVSYAEALRRLIPLEQRLGIGRPTYWKVRRHLQAERHRLDLRREERRRLTDEILRDLMVGLVPIRRYF